MYKPLFLTRNQIVEGYYHPGKRLAEVVKRILKQQDESLFILDYKSLLYLQTSSQKWAQGYEVLRQPYTETHAYAKQDFQQLLQRKITVYLTYTERDQQQKDFSSNMETQLFSFLHHLFQQMQQHKQAFPIRFILMDDEAIKYIPTLPAFIVACCGVHIGICLFVDNKTTLLAGYTKKEVDTLYTNSLVIREGNK
ncbi:hypothetical protein [Bacillus cereus]|uniref:hypothetical protein n=1 Tax=Bacillus cereus TaxID=1396 RepID=UPI0018F4197F|nr:hypothetical protein [Bacillus cereus]MBJ8025978.1 hypothetical protein [Bacillus cereus]MBJ8038226.1 hypothetical protein [Bacillus cereus]